MSWSCWKTGCSGRGLRVSRPKPFEEKSETLYLLNQDLVKLAADLAEREEASRSILKLPVTAS